jgi:hypothetical protein
MIEPIGPSLLCGGTNLICSGTAGTASSAAASASAGPVPAANRFTAQPGSLVVSPFDGHVAPSLGRKSHPPLPYFYSKY